MGKETTPPPSGTEGVNLKDALEERYLAYALSTIMHRALPDVRDGLKPVHRRLLYAMRLLKLDPGQGFKKCARVVGDVIGKYHPHGDQAVYDALVRLAQDFAQRYPLIDGQGNFGNVDGDNAAAMRYTEARMTDTAKRLLDGLDENAVDFRETYDGEDREPIVLPGGFPNLLGNGSSGIAVGMATSIPPHNAHELCEACLHLIKNPDADVDALLEFIKGPDFPTGGLLVSDQGSIREAYATGRGSFRIRARWEIEDLGRGQWAIVVTQIPYQVQKSRLIEKIAELLTARKLPLLDDVRDESAEDIRIVLVPRSKNVDANLLMESLFKLTDLENRFSLNMNVLSMGKVPMVMGLKQVLREWLDHRKEVLIRRSEHRLGQINHRLEVLEGYLIAYLNLDEVIRIIREEDDAKGSLIAAFELTDVQAEAILNMRLRSLRKLEELEIRKEHEKLSDEKDQLTKLLGSEARQWTKISREISEISEAYGPETEIGKRRTDKSEAPEADLVDIQQAMIEKEPITVIISEKGWIRALKGHQADLSTLSFKQGDKLKLSFHAETTDKIIVFTTGGKFFTLGGDRLPGGRGHGEPIRLMVEMDEAQDVVSAFVHKPGRNLLLSSNEARGFVVCEDDVIANTRKGKQVLNLGAPAEASLCVDATGDHVAIIGENRKLLVFPLAQIAQMGRGRGVRLQRYRDGSVSDIRVFKGEEGLTWTDSSGRSFTRSLEELSEWLGDRGQAGRLPPAGFPRSNRFGPKSL
ncbi:DNA topoisomerase IV subunit A [Roseibium denhamense]|uniref:DNA topoisomerase 4 subunit A n=1 Tax=Roseibium denhamense TaxID=76305 RepID=A0ABY1NYQ2_9HYPH|nr:DNA topoisomerase IV subunit A [Roseibium denhamense]MTI04787.1 DNA topoisomerase IV subunit A [Roseibium denhamense]SMP19376.1 DNA topoisomerase IV subunit A [Roseibium denhamense]